MIDYPSQADLERANKQEGGIMRKLAIVLIPLVLVAFTLGLIGCGDGEGERLSRLLQCHLIRTAKIDH